MLRATLMIEEMTLLYFRYAIIDCRFPSFFISNAFDIRSA